MGSLVSSVVLVASIVLLFMAAWALVKSKRVGAYPLPFVFFLLSACLNLLLGLHTVLDYFSREQYVRFYWANELIEQGFALALMVSIIRLAMAGEKSAAVLGQGLASVAVVMVAALLTEGQPNTASSWMTSFTRNLSFGVALMNFQVWGLLIAKRVRKREILLLASGLGLLTTGKSLGHTIRIVVDSHSSYRFVGNYIVMATAILAFYTWWCAFRLPKPQNRPHLVKAA